jgi:hypothetical protein
MKSKLWNRISRSLLIASLILPGGIVMTQPAFATSEPAKMADAFVDSIGVNTHGDYASYDTNKTVIEAKLGDSGIRYIRDHIEALSSPKSATNLNFFKDLYTGYGIKANLIMQNNGTLNDTAQRYFEAIQSDSVVLAATESVEGPNEVNSSTSDNWVAPLQNFQKDMWSRAGSDPDFANIAVLEPSMKFRGSLTYLETDFTKYGTEFYNTPQAIPCGMGKYMDYGALHVYSGGANLPLFKLNSEKPMIEDHEVCSPYAKPLMVSETGYHTAINTTATHDPVSERAQGKYIPRTFLDYFNQGIVRTYSYEFFDQGSGLTDIQDNFGLIRNNGTVKPAYTAVKNLITLLKDPGVPFTPGTLDYTLTGNTTNLSHTLLQKRDGTFYLILWLDVKDYDPDASGTKDLFPPNQSVTLTLNNPSLFTKAKTYLTNSSTTATSTTNNPTALNLSVPDEPLVVELIGGTPQQQPDLVVTDFSMSPASPVTGDTVTFSATIKNEGIGPTPASTISGVRFKVDGTTTSWSDNYTSSIASGASVTVTANGGPSGSSTWTATSGSHSIEAYVDDINRIAESNETNNVLTTTISVAAAMPDLVVKDISWTPADPITSNGVTFKAKIKNKGTGATPAGTISGVKFKVDGTTTSFSDNYTASIPAGSSVTVTANGGGAGGGATWTATDGTHTVEATVDDVNRIVESNETNNTYSESITIGSPDLIVTDISWSPASPVTGNAVTFSATIQNQGTGATADGVISGVKFQVDGVTASFSDDYTTAIPAGSSVTVTANGGGVGGGATWTATNGAHTVQAIVDDVDRIAESNESNNTFSESLSIADGIPDVKITNITWSPASPAAGDHVTFSAVIKNVGTGPTPSGVIDSVLFKIDGTTVTWETNYTTSIPPGGTATVTANGGPNKGPSYWTATNGTHTVSTVVDDINRFPESNETNNDTYSETIIVN